MKDSNTYKNYSISKLVFTMMYSDNNETSKEISDLLYSKLTNKYHLSSKDAYNIIKRDKDIINKRKDNIKNYYFDNQISYNQILKIFLKCIYSTKEANYDSLTLSELIRFDDFFINMIVMYELRIKMFNKIISQYDKEIDSIFFSNELNNDDKLYITNEIANMLNEYINRKEKEKSLLKFYIDTEYNINSTYEKLMKNIGSIHRSYIFHMECINSTSSTIEALQSEFDYESLEYDTYTKDYHIISKYKKI